VESHSEPGERRGFAAVTTDERHASARAKARLKRRVRRTKALLDALGQAPRETVLEELQLLREVILDDEVSPPPGDAPSFAVYQRRREEHEALLAALIHPVEAALLVGYLLAKSETVLGD
jgi:hypothetical protein